ncbi:hypothetical protein ACETAC_05010 [Aceticella autotrophica]|uniref:Uncharacterized protein n=1 Tax=Aceticella autotrophica TaxID=2755338 RepID=A0A975GB96_9THEO|nr:hypothetical protein [Aceticella autotrophica]QSZ28208.1 hypothetical protein ACETAC_05010 [Aceticella autotrophica]
MLANFTKNWQELLLGVDVGGMGTLIASLASIISYKIYIDDNKSDNKRYILLFTIYNLIGLILLGTMSYIILKVR